MTESFDWDDNTQEDNTPKAPKALRDAYESQKAENAALAKQVKDLADKVRESELKSKLSSKGVPEKAIGLFPKNVEPTDDEVTKWIGQYGDLFGTPTQSTETTEIATVEPTVTTQLESQLEQMQKVSQTAPPAGPKNDLMTMLANPNLQDEVPYEDFLAAMKAHGALKT